MKILTTVLLSLGLVVDNEPLTSDMLSNTASESVTDETSQEINSSASEDVQNSSSEITDSSTSESSGSEVVEPEDPNKPVDDLEEKELLQELIEKWLNGEIELDDLTLKNIYTKLSAITEDGINSALEQYIEDTEERSKVSSVAMAILSALLMLVVMMLFLRKIKTEGAIATINNTTFKKASEVIKEQVEKSKQDIEDVKEVIKKYEDKTEAVMELTKKLANNTESQLKAILGLLEINFGIKIDEVLNNGKDTNSENDSEAKK